jgi:hypothetical protein
MMACPTSGSLGLSCANQQTDPANCGKCGASVEQGQVCVGGKPTPYRQVGESWECAVFTDPPLPVVCPSSDGGVYCFSAGANCADYPL